MTDAAMRNIIAGEFRALQQRLMQQTVSRSDLNAAADRIITLTATKRDQDAIRAMLEDVRAEVKNQQQVIKQHSTYIESLNRDARNNTSQSSTLWRFAQQQT